MVVARRRHPATWWTDRPLVHLATGTLRRPQTTAVWAPTHEVDAVSPPGRRSVGLDEEDHPWELPAPADRSWRPPPSSLLSLRAVRVGIRLLGRFQVDLDDRPVPVGSWNRRSAASLVKLLALAERRRLHREQVVDALWPDSTLDERAAAAAQGGPLRAQGDGCAGQRRAGRRVRRAVPGRTTSSSTSPTSNGSPPTAVGSGDPTAVEAALDRYGGELLPDDLYEPWTFEPRERTHLRRRDLLRRAGRWYDLIAVDPTDEDAHVAVMRVMLDAGDRSGVRHQFEMLERVLREELAAEPGPEAVELHRRASEPAASGRPPSGPPTRCCRPCSSCSPTTPRSSAGRPSATPCASTGRWPRAATRCWRSSPASPASARAGSCPRWRARSTSPAATSCSARATRTSTSPTARSARRSSTTPPGSTTPSCARMAGDAADALVRLAPELAARLPAPSRTTPARRLDARRGPRRHRPVAGRQRRGHAAAARARGPPLVDVDDARCAAPPDAPGPPRAAADRRHHPRLQARPRRRAGRAARRARPVTGRAAGDAAGASIATRSPSSSAMDRTTPARCSPRRTATRCSSPTSPPQVGGDPLPGWLHQRDQLLDDATRDLLDQAATFGTEFDARLLAAAVDAPLLDVLALLEAAEAAGLVVPRPGTAPSFAFVHALFRSVRYRELPLRRRLHAPRPRRGRAGDARRRRAVAARSGPATPASPCRSSIPARRSTLALGAAQLRRARLRLRRGDRPPRAGARRRPADRAARSRRHPRPRGARRRGPPPPRRCRRVAVAARRRPPGRRPW